MNLIINTVTKDWHISSLEVLGKDEILISDFVVLDEVKCNSHLYKVNDSLTGLVLNDEKVNQEYMALRKQEYDKLNQFELQYDDIINGTTTWQDSIIAIKNKYPKPE